MLEEVGGRGTKRSTRGQGGGGRGEGGLDQNESLRGTKRGRIRPPQTVVQVVRTSKNGVYGQGKIPREKR